MNYGYGNTYGGFFDKMKGLKIGAPFDDGGRLIPGKLTDKLPDPRESHQRLMEARRAADPCSHIPSTIDNCPPGAQCFMGPQANPEWVACREEVRLAEEEAQREAIRQEVRTEMQPVPWWVWAIGGAALAMLVVRR
jgi:hypothetical protein